MLHVNIALNVYRKHFLALTFQPTMTTLKEDWMLCFKSLLAQKYVRVVTVRRETRDGVNNVMLVLASPHGQL